MTTITPSHHPPLKKASGAIHPVTSVLVVLLTLSTLAAGWAWHHRNRSLDLAARDITDLANIRQIAAEIKTLRTGPTRAAEGELTTDALNTICERAAANAKLPANALVEVIPFAPQRVGRTDYQQLATRVTLEAVTIEQLTRFMVAVTQDAAAMTVKQIELSVNRADTTRWDTSITIAGLIYTPRESQSFHSN